MLQRKPAPTIDAVALRVVRCWVRRYLRSSGSFRQVEEDDLVQECLMRLADRTDRFNPERARWSTYCRLVAQGYLANRQQRRRRQLAMTSLHETHQDRCGQDYVPEHTAEPKHSHHNQGKPLRPEVEHMELETDLRLKIAGLPGELRVVCESYLQTPSTTEVAQHLGISRTTVIRRLRKIHAHLAGMNLEHYRR